MIDTVFIVLGIYIVIATIGGFRRGFLKSLFGLATWFLTFALTTGLVKELRQPIADTYFNLIGKSLSKPVSYIVAFFVVMIGFKTVFSIIGKIIHKASKVPGVGCLDHSLGAVLGLVKGIFVSFIVFFIVYLLSYLGQLNIQNAGINESQFFSKIMNNNIFSEIAKYLLTNTF